jgi:ammonium transporter, Amt family
MINERRIFLKGGASALAAGIMLGPRLNRYDKSYEKSAPPMGNPINACVGLFFLWWGWLAFNSGSTYGMSDGKWEYAARSSFMTMLASFGGGSYALIHSFVKNKGKLDPSDIINGILGSLVGITGKHPSSLIKKFSSILIVTIDVEFHNDFFLIHSWMLSVSCLGINSCWCNWFNSHSFFTANSR